MVEEHGVVEVEERGVVEVEVEGVAMRLFQVFGRHGGVTDVTDVPFHTFAPDMRLQARKKLGFQRLKTRNPLIFCAHVA